jgi:KDO2-lipid IV(A) lauroyltransferase
VIKLILTFFSILPLRLNHFIGSSIGRFLYFTNSKSKCIISKNIDLCFPELNQEERGNLVKKSLIETGKGLTESGFIWFNNFKTNAKYITKTTGMEHLRSNRPVILLVPHFGCWEITGRVLSLTTPVVFLYKPLRSKKQEACLISKRQQGDLSMATADKKGVIKLQRALSKGDLIGILPDQDPGEEGGISAPFFNHDANTMTLLAKLVRKNNAKVIMTWATRLEKGKGYELNLQPINILSDSVDLISDVTLMNQTIEKLVRTKPEQYLWNYKRFKSSINY